MMLALWSLQGLLALAGGVCAVMLIVSAFRKDFVQGLLALFFPLYLAYWAFARFDHPQRRPILWTFFGAPVAACALGLVSLALAMHTTG